MRKTLLGTLFLATLLVANVAFAQGPNQGPVWKMIYYHIRPGQADAFWKDVQENAKPIFEESKKQGVLVDYKILVNSFKDNPGDWDVLFAVAFPNYAMLDQAEAKVGAIYNKHYGSPEATAEAVKKRQEFHEILAIRLVREVR